MNRPRSIATWLTAIAIVVLASPGKADPAAAARSGEVVLLDFAASWCGPCKQMAPIVGDIAAAGWVVRHVDVDREADLVRRFGVTGVPCYVLLVKGHEVGRINGATTRAELEALLAKSASPLGVASPIASAPPQSEQPTIAGVPLPANPAPGHLATEPPPMARTMPATGSSIPPSPTATGVMPASAATTVDTSSPASGRSALESKLLSATARLRVEDSTGVSWATGTVIDCRQGEALILTCGHVFRDSDGKGTVEVDLFGPHGPRGVAGQVISWDLKRDLALVSIFTETTIDPVRVGGVDRATPVGSPVVTVGCNGGKDPTIHHSRVTAVDKYLGPSNLQVAGQPVQGRSGGGLFAGDGTLIGVCNAADPADNEGLFAALPSIHEQLEEAGLAFVYRNVYPSNGLDIATGPHVPAMPSAMPAVSFDRRDRADAVPTASVGMPDDGASLGSSSDRGQPIGMEMPTTPTLTPTPTSTPGASQPAPSGSLTAGEAALIDHVRAHGGKAEVICIVRPHGAADASSEVFVLKNARADFVDHLSEAHHGHATGSQAPARDHSDVALLPSSTSMR